VFGETLVNQVAQDYHQIANERLPVYDTLAECFEQLETRSREALRLRYAEQMKTPQIAAALGSSQIAARVVLTRARTAIRLCIERHRKQLDA
jgi:RNA polymerase sigma factor (sigma-70 family)